MAQFIPGASEAALTIRKEYTATGTGALALSTTTGKRFKLLYATVSFSAIPTTAEDVVLTLDSGNGAAYDVPIYRKDPSTGDGTGDLFIDGADYMKFGYLDQLDLTYANSDGRTIGAVIAVEELAGNQS